MLLLLAAAHFFVDLYSSAIGAYQPLLVARHGLTLAQAGLLGGVLVFSSSLMQPVYGYLSDRYHSKLFSALAPAVAGVFISALGLAPGYGWLMPMVILGGAGIASFHPQASAWVTLGVSANRQRWFAVFVSAGTLGMALGPSFFSALLTLTGLGGSWIAALPGILVSAVLVGVLKEPQGVEKVQKSYQIAPLRAVFAPLFVLYLLVFIRSIVQITFAQFLPLYLTRERGFGYVDANHALTLYLTAGAIGGFLGGHLADRFGGRKVILASMIGCVPFLVVFFLAEGWVALSGLAVGGLVLLFTIPVNVVMAQELVPSQASTVSAITMGFAWGLAGLIFIPITGWAADHFTLGKALGALVGFPLVGFALAWKLPESHEKKSSLPC
jgi:FSR family fosmidomycin resistance protein-like MFS transporter